MPVKIARAPARRWPALGLALVRYLVGGLGAGGGGGWHLRAARGPLAGSLRVALVRFGGVAATQWPGAPRPPSGSPQRLVGW
jgi:hypothetical protein